MKPVVWFTRQMPVDEVSLGESIGIKVVEVPLIQIKPYSKKIIAQQIIRLPKPDAIVLTSKNGAMGYLKSIDLVNPKYGEVPVYALGEKTAKPLQENKIPFFDCKATTGIDTANFVINHLFQKNACIWHFCGDKSRKETGETFQSASYSYNQIVSYSTQSKKIKLKDSKPDGIVFYSPSAIQSYVGQVETGNLRIPVFSIGPTTSSVAVDLGFKTVFTAHTPSVEAVLDEIKKYFNLQKL